MIYNSSNNFDYNDCISHGACSVSPNISSMQEVMFLLLRQITFYLLKLKEFDINKLDIEQNLIFQIAFMDAAKDLSEAQILDEFSKEYNNLVKVRKEYLNLCKEKNLICKDLKNLLKFSPNTSLSNILKRGEQEIISRNKKFDGNKKYYAEILFSVIKSVCINLTMLQSVGENCKNASDEILKALNIFNATKILPDKIKNSIISLADNDIEVLKLISDYRKENFGKIEESVVSHSTKTGKAIMISGNNLYDLKKLLEFLDNEDIDIYTNGNLITAHVYSYFKNSKNLKGHFGSGSTSSILDFATFPGAILLTKNETQNIQYLYRGRIFTTDDITPSGISKIENYDFSPLINSALKAKGFKKGQKRNPETVGFDEEYFDKKIDEIISKNYEKIFIIGHSAQLLNQNDYFKKLFSIMPEKTYAISFTGNIEQNNVYSINLGNDYSLIYLALHKIFQKIPISSDKLVFFLTKCDTNSLSSIISLKNHGAKNVFLSQCPPLVINPAVLREFSKIFDIKQITNPKNDIQF